MNKNLEELRQILDEIDSKLIELLGKRTDVVREIGAFKKVNGIGLVNEERKKRVLETRKKLGEKYNLDGEFMGKLYKLIHDYSVEVERES